MGCEQDQGVGFYRPRQPKETAFHKLVEKFYPRFKAVYEGRLAAKRTTVASHDLPRIRL